MKSIQLQTTQNVKIDYEIASLLDRVLAFFIDLIAVFLAYSILSLVVFLFLILTRAHEAFYSLANGLFLLPIMVFYTLVMESLNKGRTLGKMVLKIQVIRIDGGQAQFMDYFVRWVFRIIDLWFSFGGLAAICISGSVKGQRIGGVLSNTTVVKSNPALRTSLKRILNIDSRSSYKPVYPQVKQFKESDMLLIKQTLDRYRRFRNRAHKKAIEEIVLRTAKEMEVPVPKSGKLKFLKTIIKDYIVLTR